MTEVRNSLIGFRPHVGRIWPLLHDHAGRFINRRDARVGPGPDYGIEFDMDRANPPYSVLDRAYPEELHEDVTRGLSNAYGFGATSGLAGLLLYTLRKRLWGDGGPLPHPGYRPESMDTSDYYTTETPFTSSGYGSSYLNSDFTSSGSSFPTTDGSVGALPGSDSALSSVLSSSGILSSGSSSSVPSGSSSSSAPSSEFEPESSESVISEVLNSIAEGTFTTRCYFCLFLFIF